MIKKYELKTPTSLQNDSLDGGGGKGKGKEGEQKKKRK